MLEQYLLLRSTLGFSPDIEGQFQRYQEAADTLWKNIRTEYQKYVRAYGDHFICHYSQGSRIGYIKTTTPITMIDYQIEPDGIVAVWMIQKIDVSEQTASPVFKKEKGLIRANVIESLRYINRSAANAYLNDAEVDEIVNKLTAPSETVYQNYLQYLVQDMVKMHGQRDQIRHKLHSFRMNLAQLITMEPHDTKRIFACIRSLEEKKTEIVQLLLGENRNVPPVLQREFDEYTQLSNLFAEYINSKAYRDVKERKKNDG
mgnify:CR=1 FL=1